MTPLPALSRSYSQPRRARLAVQALEDRVTPATPVYSPATQTLTIIAAQGDRIVVAPIPNEPAGYIRATETQAPTTVFDSDVSNRAVRNLVVRFNTVNAGAPHLERGLAVGRELERPGCPGHPGAGPSRDSRRKCDLHRRGRCRGGRPGHRSHGSRWREHGSGRRWRRQHRSPQGRYRSRQPVGHRRGRYRPCRTHGHKRPQRRRVGLDRPGRRQERCCRHCLAPRSGRQQLHLHGRRRQRYL